MQKLNLKAGGIKGQKDDHQHARYQLTYMVGVMTWQLVENVAPVASFAHQHVPNRRSELLALHDGPNPSHRGELVLGSSMKSYEIDWRSTPPPRFQRKPTQHELAVKPPQYLSSRRPTSGALGACLFHGKRKRRSCKGNTAPSRLDFARADGPPSGTTTSSTAATETPAQPPSGRCRAHWELPTFARKSWRGAGAPGGLAWCRWPARGPWRVF